MNFLIGVDEAGRGPLAGPVAVGVVMLPVGFDIRKIIPDVADSKKLSSKKREEIYTLWQNFAHAKKCQYRVMFASAQKIDKVGISRAVRECVWQGVRKLAPNPKGVQVLLDGLLVAPPEYAQETIVRGDATEPIISLASIVAKVSRDRLMVRLSKTYPGYGFEKHKGYGTRAHYNALKRHGVSKIHRKSFLW